MEGQLAGKVAVVTGAGSGMGRSAALAFAREGARVVAVDVDGAAAEGVAAEIVAGGGQALAVGADVRRGAEVRAVVDRALSTFGTVDALACIAGVLRRSKIEDIDEDEWDLVLDVNLKGVFLCCQAVLPTMKERRAGKIVILASMAGRATSTFGGAHYTASKAGVLGLCRHVAREAAPFGINVNAINPGVIDTPMVQTRSTPEEIARITAGVPFGRFGTAEEVADLVVFLASDRSAYITGAAVDIHGGEMFI
jgi:NAD(P)-dependent dehydrogenase (short-subunit alcohol dehydrogenase family)